ncbi:MAG: hypothetical protein IT406_03190 [Candidatus Yanofskybacteria bacterium]|nr:hypothetical protein [Candidatus Yanofskybacteria bacterium]
MSRKSGVHTPNAAYERIAAAIQAFPLGTEFSPKDIQTAAPGVPRGSIHMFVSAKHRSRWLERTARGKYRVGGVRIKTTLPMGIIAEAVWAVLFTERSRRYLRLAEITGEAEEFVGRPGVSLYHGVARTLFTWHRNGHLERTGKRREYRYRVKEGVTERPVCTR